MSDNFDIAISVKEAAVNHYISQLFSGGSIRSRYFQGSGVEGASWKAEEPPTVKLEAPLDDTWRNAYKVDGSQTVRPADNGFTVHFPRITLSMQDVGTTTIPLDVLCAARENDKHVRVEPLGVGVDLSSQSHNMQNFYKTTVIPGALGAAGAVLSGGPIPTISFHGIDFGEAVLRVAEGHVTVVVNMAGKGMATPPSGWGYFQMCNKPLTIAASRHLRQTLIDNEVRKLAGKSVSRSGSIDLGIGEGSYSAKATLDKVEPMKGWVGAGDGLSIGVTPYTSFEAHASIHPNLLDRIRRELGKLGGATLHAGEEAVHGISSAASKVGHALKHY